MTIYSPLKLKELYIIPNSIINPQVITLESLYSEKEYFWFRSVAWYVRTP